MSLSQMQRAIALLIRLPDHNRGDGLNAFIQEFDLTLSEYRQVKALSRDTNVRKYGHSMWSVRFDQIRKPLVLSRNYIHAELLEKISRYYFEPEATEVSSNSVVLAFLEFIRSNSKVREMILKESPPFAIDLLKFDLALGHFRFRRYKEPVFLPAGALVRHRAFLVIEFEYDIAAFKSRIGKELKGGSSIRDLSWVPDRRNNVLLFLKKDNEFDCRIFEVDMETKIFLDAQLKDPIEASPLPDSLATFVDMGFCKFPPSLGRDYAE